MTARQDFIRLHFIRLLKKKGWERMERLEIPTRSSSRAFRLGIVGNGWRRLETDGKIDQL